MAELPEDAAKAGKVLATPPDGGLIVDVTTKLLGGYEKGERNAERNLNSLGRDHLWLRPDEATARPREIAGQHRSPAGPLSPGRQHPRRTADVAPMKCEVSDRTAGHFRWWVLP